MALDIVRAESADQAASVLAADDGARFLGGGTFLVRALTGGDLTIRKLVLMEGLGEVAVGEKVTIGSAATMAIVAAAPGLSFLAPVAESIGGPAIRAMATVGGNLFARSPYGDFTVALLALGAKVVRATADGETTDDLDQFLGRQEVRGVVRSVRFTRPADGAFRYLKITRKHPHGASVLSIAALLPVADGKLANVRVAYGAMAGRPMRSAAVESALEGRTLDAASIADAVAVAAEGTEPEDDPQASAWYRREVVGVHLARLLSGEPR